MSERSRRRSNRCSSFSPDLLERRLLLSAGDLFISNSNNNTVAEYTQSGTQVSASLFPGLNGPNANAVSGSDMFVANFGSTASNGSIGEYTTAGATVNAALVSGLNGPSGIAVSGTYLFVTNYGSGTVGEYTTSGTTVKASLISGLTKPTGIVVSGSYLFVASQGNSDSAGKIGEYTTSGMQVAPALVTGLGSPDALAVTGSDLFVTNGVSNTIGEYTTAGGMVNSSLVSSGLSSPGGITISGSNMFVVNFDSGTIGEYATSGTIVNPSLISGLDGPEGIAVAATQLAFATEPASPAAGSLGTVVVNIEDANGNLIPGDDSQVTVAVSGGVTLGGTTTVTAVNGVATFSNLSIATPGTAYTLTATDSALSPATSTPFDVTASVAPPSPLVPAFGNVVLPPEVVAGAKLKAKAPVVITNTGSAFKGNVTVDLFADTGTTLDGNQMLITSLTKKASLKTGKGKTFNFHLKALPVGLPDGTYHLLAEVLDPSNLTNVTATTQTVQVAAAFIQPAVSVGVTPAVVAPGKRATVAVTITNNGNVAASGIQITLSPSSDGITPIAGVILDSISKGSKLKPNKSKTIKLHFKVPVGGATGNYFPYVSVDLGGVSTTEVGSTTFSVS